MPFIKVFTSLHFTTGTKPPTTLKKLKNKLKFKVIADNISLGVNQKKKKKQPFTLNLPNMKSYASRFSREPNIEKDPHSESQRHEL